MSEVKFQKILKDRLKGFTGFCGIEIDEVSEGFSRASCELQPQHLNPQGKVHGGMISTLMDVCGGTAAIYASKPPRMIVTQSADIHYMRPIKGGVMRAEARALKSGRSTCVVQVDVYGESEKPAATAIYEFFYTAAPVEYTTDGGET